MENQNGQNLQNQETPTLQQGSIFKKKGFIFGILAVGLFLIGLIFVIIMASSIDAEGVITQSYSSSSSFTEGSLKSLGGIMGPVVVASMIMVFFTVLSFIFGTLGLIFCLIDKNAMKKWQFILGMILSILTAAGIGIAFIISQFSFIG